LPTTFIGKTEIFAGFNAPFYAKYLRKLDFKFVNIHITITCYDNHKSPELSIVSVSVKFHCLGFKSLHKKILFPPVSDKPSKLFRDYENQIYKENIN